LQSMLSGISKALQNRGVDPASATQQAWARVQSLVLRQATMLSYIDCFWLLGIAIGMMVPLVFIMKKSKPGGAVAVH
jgi:MFS transporter, DHA2 family, multidrug resistance protein